MPLPVSGQVGPTAQNASDGSSIEVRQGRTGDVVVSELCGRFEESNYRGNVFCGGMTVTSINNATFTSATTGQTATPIIGLWNPLGSGYNAVILQAILGVVITALQNTGGGPFVWMAALNNGAISTGATPFNRKTLTASGSVMKNMAGAALTGMAGTLALLGSSALGGGNAFNIATLDTAAGFSTIYQPTVENLDGSLIVPPGGVLALMATTTPVAQSAASMILWREVLLP